MKILKCLLIIMIFNYSNVYGEVVDINKLANAIYIAEGGNKTSHPYGILTHYKHTTPRQACINTIKSNLKRFNTQSKEKDFIVFMSKSYCPIGAKNDPKELNRNWVKNVKYYYNK